MNQPVVEVEIEVTVKQQTAKALRVYDGKTEVWIPRSMITDYSPDTENDYEITSIFLPEWFATEKGLT